MLGEDPVHELAAAADAHLLEERLDVVADGVRREVQLGGYLGAEPAGDRPSDLGARACSPAASSRCSPSRARSCASRACCCSMS
jgi:hypothetical protein